jgi:hypothetical protein
LPLPGYAGKYSSDVFGDAEINVKDGNLHILFPNNNDLTLDHWNFDYFKGSYNHFWWDKSTVQFF